MDAKINDGGKIEPHEIASKTQMFTERYMVDWLLQNSLGPMWLAMCKKHEWTPEAQSSGTLDELEKRRVEWRAKRDAGEVELTDLMPLHTDLERQWAYYVPQPIPDDAVEHANDSVRDLKILDPAVGSGHFLVAAFDLLHALYQEEARHRGEDGKNASGYWSCVACVLPFLNLEIDPLCQLLQQIIPKAKAGSYGWEIYGAIARLAETQPDLGKALLERFAGSLASPLRCLLADILIGLSRNDIPSHYEVAKQWVSSGESVLVSHGCLSIGAFDYSTEGGKELHHDAINTLIELESNPPEEVLVSLVTAYGRLLDLDPRCIEGIERLASSHEPAAISSRR